MNIKVAGVEMPTNRSVDTAFRCKKIQICSIIRDVVRHPFYMGRIQPASEK